jgi:hypothetical protein
VLRATGTGLVAALLALLVFVRGLFALLDPVAPDLAQVGAGALIVFAAAVLGGAAGRGRRRWPASPPAGRSAWSGPSAPAWRARSPA